LLCGYLFTGSPVSDQRQVYSFSGVAGYFHDA